MKKYRLDLLKEDIRHYKKLTNKLRRDDSHKFKSEDLQLNIYKGVKLCESLLCFYLEEKGFSINYGDGTVILDERYKSFKNIDKNCNIHVFDFCIQKKGLLPDECLKLISFIKDINFNKLYNKIITYEIAVSFFDAVDSFLFWFDEETNEELSISDIIGVGAIAGAALLPLFPVAGAIGFAAAALFGKSGVSSKNTLGVRHKPDYSKIIQSRENAASAQLENISKFNDEDDDVSAKCITDTLSFSYNEQYKDKTDNDSLNCYEKKLINQKDMRSEGMVRALLKNMDKKIDAMYLTQQKQILISQKHMEETQEGFDKISKQIAELGGQIDAYQSLIERQLEKSVNEQEKERLISAFADECAERVAKQVRADTDEKIISLEKKKLILSLGENCWTKLEETSRENLVNAKVFFSKLLELERIKDYSGVCLPITKALEVELYKRFYTNYMRYLKEKYNNDYTKYPSALLYKIKYSKTKHKIVPLGPKYFTMGTVAFILCIKQDNDDTEQQIENNKARLLEYAKERLLSKYSNNEIEKILTNCAKAIEEIREKYRNRCSHREAILQLQAKECMNYVIDVEKLLKKMIDTFDE